MMKPTCVKIAVERTDGGVSILSFMTVGRGNVLPSGAQWIDLGNGTWSRNPSDEAVAEEVARAVPDAMAWHRILDDDVPTDRTFRDALVVKNGALTHDIPKAREIVRMDIRHARAAAFSALDAEWMKALGQGDTKTAEAIEAQRQVLRDAPADPRIDAATTLDELKTIVPVG